MCTPFYRRSRACVRAHAGTSFSILLQESAAASADVIVVNFRDGSSEEDGDFARRINRQLVGTLNNTRVLAPLIPPKAY